MWSTFYSSLRYVLCSYVVHTFHLYLILWTDFSFRSMASLNEQLVCALCPHERTAHLHFDLTGFLKHMKLFHAYQAGIRVTCGISGCQRSFSNFRTFQDHVSAMHRYQQDIGNVTLGLDRCPGEDTYNGWWKWWVTAAKMLVKRKKLVATRQRVSLQVDM